MVCPWPACTRGSSARKEGSGASKTQAAHSECRSLPAVKCFMAKLWWMNFNHWFRKLSWNQLHSLTLKMDLNRHAQKHEQHERADTQQRCFKSIHPETRDMDRIQNVPHLRFETYPSNDRLSGRRMIISWGSDIKSSNELNK